VPTAAGGQVPNQGTKPVLLRVTTTAAGCQPITDEPTRPHSQSFFALLQKNVLDRQRWNTREELRLAIITWIERTYHRRRRQRRLGRLTPIEYETLNLAATAA
jgi:transposase InsO family protein